jgi:trk system potassium uptake protein TrkH
MLSFGAIFYILGWVLSCFGLMMIAPAALSWGYQDDHSIAFLNTMITTVFIGGLFILLNRNAEKRLSHKDGFFLTLLTWVTLSFAGAAPLYFSGTAPSFIDAFFEAVSGLTTTGATVLSGLDDMDHGILLWRSLMQWLGGMGIIVLAIAVLPFLGVGGMQLYKSEMPGVEADKLQPRLRETAKMLWIVYVCITIVCAACYNLAGMNTFDAITHALTTAATGGYSTHDASFAYFNSVWIEGICIFFMLVGAVNYSLHYLFLSGADLKVYFANSELRTFLTIVLIAVGFIFFTLVGSQYMTADNALRQSLFNVVSVMTTTGYTTANYGAWPVFVSLVMLALMFIGGSTGSTAGGMKVMRIMLIVKQGAKELSRLIHPRGVSRIKIGFQNIPDHVMQAVWSFAGLYILIFIILSMAISSYGIDQITAFSAAGATLTGLGPGLGDVGPASNYGHLPDGVKFLLCLSMLLGRLEIFTILVIFMPAFWKK